MPLQDKKSIYQILGCLIKKPSLLLDKEKYTLTPEDFPEKFHRIIFSAINNLFLSGAEVIDEIIIDNYLSNYDSQYIIFNDSANKGIEYIQTATEIANLSNFDYNYLNIKKFSLLRELDEQGFNVNFIYNDNLTNNVEKEKMQLLFDSYSLEDILNVFERKQIELKQKYLNSFVSYSQHIGKGLGALKEKLKVEPDIGAPLYSNILNTITRGMRLKKFYMRSAPTGIGKTRLSLGDSANLACDRIYDIKAKKWVTNGTSEPVLFITTELDIDEIQTPLIAFISGVSEDKILENKYTKEEEARMDYAIKVLEESNLWVEYIPDFNIEDIETIIKKYIIINKVKYVFFDYIHTSLKLLEEIGKQTRGMKLREDNILLMFSDRLKKICNAYGISFFSATQVNGEYKNAKDADQNLLRGAKAIADKIDVGIVALEPTKADLKALSPILQKGFYPIPNLVYHIYKNRRGKLVRVKLWIYFDAGTCRTTDLFLTDKDYKLVPVEALKIELYDEKTS